MKEFNEPERPTYAQGWQQRDVGAVSIKGQFVLNKGQSVNDGTVGIRVVDIRAGSCAPFREPEYPSTKVQFFSVPDQRILCEDVFRVGGSRLDVIEGCGKSLPRGVLGISGINSKDNWVAFDLR
jgi:hypothetical protein